MSRVALAIGLLAALAGCAGEPHRQVNGGYTLPPRAAPSAPPTQAAGQALKVEPSEAVWHLRAGLNVAALSCRGSGRTPVAAHYARLLSHHKALLAQAYSGEQRRYGKGLDRHQTQLYNRFSNQKNPAKFCSMAASVAREAAAMDSPALARNAGGLLGRIA
ncbi:MAG: hypothetical protein ACKOPM_14395 [Novosphingobium sp.]